MGKGSSQHAGAHDQGIDGSHPTDNTGHSEGVERGVQTTRACCDISVYGLARLAQSKDPVSPVVVFQRDQTQSCIGVLDAQTDGEGTTWYSLCISTCGTQAHLRQTRCIQSICLHVGGRATPEEEAAGTCQPRCSMSEGNRGRTVFIHGWHEAECHARRADTHVALGVVV